MVTRSTMRQVPDSAPLRIYDFGHLISDKLEEDDKSKREAHESSGKISGGKLGNPTLWAVLEMIGIPREFDPYLLGKFMRGNDVEARAIQMLTGIPIDQQEQFEGQPVKVMNAIINGVITMQKKQGYRGGTGYEDLRQEDEQGLTVHEIKSSTKLAYDRVAGSGRSSKSDPAPYYHHAIQVAYYALGEEADTGVFPRALLHYFNADDYRLCTFEINVNDYREEIDYEIDSIELAFAQHQLPIYEPFLDFHKAYKKTTFGDWNDLDADQLMQKLESEYPNQYQKFMETKV